MDYNIGSMKTVLFQGTFEIINAGHVQAFEFAKSHGDHLVIALNTDDLVRSYKQREPVIPWDQKKRILKAIRYIDAVIAAPKFSPMEILEELKPDVFVVGSEWVESKAEEIAFVKGYGGEVVISPRFPAVYTSDIKRTLLAEAQGR